MRVETKDYWHVETTGSAPFKVVIQAGYYPISVTVSKSIPYTLENVEHLQQICNEHNCCIIELVGGESLEEE